MKLKLPNKTVSLDSSLSIEDKKLVVENLLQDKIEFHSETMTLEEYLHHTWTKQTSKTILDMLSYYLTKEEKNLEITSHAKEKEMQKGSKRHTTFSNLTLEQQEELGII